MPQSTTSSRARSACVVRTSPSATKFANSWTTGEFMACSSAPAAAFVRLSAQWHTLVKKSLTTSMHTVVY